jgi:ADP-glucose pyrophosphorylase
MGIYVFTAASLFELLFEDAVRKNSSHDFGKNIIPNIISRLNVHAFHFQDKNKKSVPYWRDVGTLDAYYQANMDLVGIDPVLNLYDTEWPIRTFQPQFRHQNSSLTTKEPEAKAAEAKLTIASSAKVASSVEAVYHAAFFHRACV